MDAAVGVTPRSRNRNDVVLRIVYGEVCRDRDLIVRLTDTKGQVWAEKRWSAKANKYNSQLTSIFVPDNTPPKEHEYSLVMRIVPQGGSWDEPLAEKAIDQTVRK